MCRSECKISNNTTTSIANKIASLSSAPMNCQMHHHSVGSTTTTITTIPAPTTIKISSVNVNYNSPQPIIVHQQPQIEKVQIQHQTHQHANHSQQNRREQHPPKTHRSFPSTNSSNTRDYKLKIKNIKKQQQTLATEGPLGLIVMTFISVAIALLFGWARDILRYTGMEKKKSAKDPNPKVSLILIY